MKTTKVYDQQGWLQHVVIGDYRKPEPVIGVEPSGDGAVVLALSGAGGSMDVDITPTQLDDVIRGLLTARTAIKVDRRRMAERMAQIAAAADERARLLGRAS